MTEQEFIWALKEQGIELSKKQIKQFQIYFEELVTWNQKMNLTAIVEKEEVYLKHFYDSLTIAFDFKFTNQTIVDVGAGAGFPSIPLKIVFPNLKITIVDSLNKRITFLNHLFNVLKLEEVRAKASRAEEYAKDNFQQADIVMARAVARLNILDELCLPLVKIGGYFLSLKGKNALEEVNEAKNGINILGGEIENISSFQLTNADNRSNIIIKKIKGTSNKYPRNFGTIKKKPL